MNQIGALLKEKAQKTHEDVMRELSGRCAQLEVSIGTFKAAAGAMIQNEIRDKVRVEEV